MAPSAGKVTAVRSKFSVLAEFPTSILLLLAYERRYQINGILWSFVRARQPATLQITVYNQVHSSHGRVGPQYNIEGGEGSCATQL